MLVVMSLCVDWTVVLVTFFGGGQRVEKGEEKKERKKEEEGEMGGCAGGICHSSRRPHFSQACQGPLAALLGRETLSPFPWADVLLRGCP